MLELSLQRIIRINVFMTRKRPDYTEARNYYIKGERNEYPTLQDIATEFNYSLSTLRKQAANEGLSLIHI